MRDALESRSGPSLYIAYLDDNLLAVHHEVLNGTLSHNIIRHIHLESIAVNKTNVVIGSSNQMLAVSKLARRFLNESSNYLDEQGITLIDYIELLPASHVSAREIGFI